MPGGEVLPVPDHFRELTKMVQWYGEDGRFGFQGKAACYRTQQHFTLYAVNCKNPS